MSKKQKNQSPPAPAETPELLAEPSNSNVLFFEHRWMPFFVLAGAALVAYGASVPNDFVFFDDDKAILYNKALQNPSWAKFFGGQNLGMFAPLTWIVYWIGKGISGEAAWGHHLISLLLHMANAMLAYAVLRQLTGRIWAAFAAALIFAVHPMQAEAVCWAAAMSAVLFSTFYLGGLLAWVRFTQRSTRWAYVLALLLFLLACISKSAAVTFSAVIVAVDIYAGKNWTSPRFWLQKLPFFALSAVFTLHTFTTRAQEGHDIEITSKAFSSVDRFFMVCQTLLFYPVKLLLPFGYSVAYPFIKVNGAWHWTYLAAPFVLAALGFLTWKYLRNRPNHLLGLTLYFLPLVAMLPYRTVGSFELRSDRYVYLSCWGLFFFLFLFLEKQKTIVRTGILGAVAIGLAILAALQTQVWNNGVNLFKNCVAKTPESSLCQCNLAYNSLITNDFEGSVRHYSEALRYDASTVEAYNGRGQAYLYLKRYPEALSDFDRAIQAGIVTPKLYLNKGKSLINLKRFEEAVPSLSRSLELEPKTAETWLLRAKAQQQLGNITPALEDYGKALDIEPNALEARMNRAVILFGSKQYEAAIADNTAALALAPEPAQVPILLNRANCYLMLGNPQKALEDANKAIGINPQYTRGYQTRAAIWQALGQPAKMQEDMAKVK